MASDDSTEHVGTMPGVGELIGGRYRLEALIGHGALGTVMRARHITMGRDVAVKLLDPHISGHPTIRHRLIERVHRAQKLHHPNNCRLFDFGQADGCLFVVMELLHGATLQTVIDRGAPFPVGWGLDIGMQLLDGLGEAHDDEFVHRNLKPRNIFLLPRRRGGQQVKILDYGLASSLDSLPDDGDDGSSGDDREAEICGTAAYLAPETLVDQTSGEPTDVYAVGLMLIELFTGQQVCSGDSLAQLLYRQIHTSVQLPAKLAWTSLGKVLLKSVNKHPDHRYADADAFYEALEQASETTATYFRLNPADLNVRTAPMSPEMLARKLHNHRRGDRGGGDDDLDDDADSDPADRLNAAGTAPPPVNAGLPKPGRRSAPSSAGGWSTSSRSAGRADWSALRGGHPLRNSGEETSDSPGSDAQGACTDRADPSSSSTGDHRDSASTQQLPDDAATGARGTDRWWFLGIDRRLSNTALIVVLLAISVAGIGLYLTFR